VIWAGEIPAAAASSGKLEEAQFTVHQVSSALGRLPSLGGFIQTSNSLLFLNSDFSLFCFSVDAIAQRNGEDGRRKRRKSNGGRLIGLEG
jgi:hypothetical protein